MNLEEKFTYDLSKQLSDSIDFDLLSDVMIACGWKKIVLGPMTHETSQGIDHWIKENVKGKHRTLGLVWLFEKDHDALMFGLRWAN